MRYKIADEIVQYEFKSDTIIRRFEEYISYDMKNYAEDIFLDSEGLVEFVENKKQLSMEQCELLYTLQMLFYKMILRNKLLIHASILVVDKKSYVFMGKPDSGKSYISQKLKESNQENYILGDDRTILGFEHGQLLAWNTPWSKKGINSTKGIPVKSMFYIKEDDVFALEKITIEEFILYSSEYYPNEYRHIAYNLLYRFIHEEDCYLVKNNKRSFDKDVLEKIIYDL